MDVKLLIDAIVRQTTVLIAQIATSAGIRAPLAHVADQVFVDLATEIEAQGVGRKVAADMFGLALRSYQKKVQRLTESATVRDKTLWEAVLDFLEQHGTVTRERIFARFRHDPEREVGAVLNDLVSEGLVYSTGRGAGAVFGVSSEADRRRVAQQERRDSIESLVWLVLYRQPSRIADLTARLSLDEDVVRAAVDALVGQGRVRDRAGTLTADSFVVPVGSEQGWEIAVFDHFSAMANAIAAKIQRGKGRSTAGDVLGGATLTFEVSRGHPLEDEVYGLLARVRRDVNDLWNRVVEQNARHPIADEDKQNVTFYFGQNARDADRAAHEGNP
jgi:hypothetical protein